MTGLLSLLKKPSPPPSPLDPGVVLGVLEHVENGMVVDQIVLRHRERAPVMVIGPSEIGKTTAVLMTTAAEWHGSAFFFDYKGELKHRIGKMRERFGPVVVLEFHRRGGPRWNPLMEIREGDDFELDCRNMAEILCDRGGRREHWDDAGVNYLAGVIAHVVLSGHDKTLRGVRDLILRRDEGAQELIEFGRHPMVVDAGKAVFKHPLHPPDNAGRRSGGRDAVRGKPVSSKGSDLSDDDEKERESPYRDSIYATCETHLSLVESLVVAHQTAESDFRLSDLMAMDRPMSLILSAGAKQMRAWKKLYKLFITMLIDAVADADNEEYTSDGRKKKHRLLLAIDEFLQFGVEEAANWSNYLRSFDVKLLILNQSLKAVKEMRGPGFASLMENCVRIQYRSRGPEEASLIEQILGNVDIETPTLSTTKRTPIDTPSVTEGVRVDRRPRMEVMDILNQDKRTIFVTGLNSVYKIRAANPMEDLPWAPTWQSLLGPAIQPWQRTEGCNPWQHRLPTLPLLTGHPFLSRPMPPRSHPDPGSGAPSTPAPSGRRRKAMLD